MINEVSEQLIQEFAPKDIAPEEEFKQIEINICYPWLTIAFQLKLFKISLVDDSNAIHNKNGDLFHEYLYNEIAICAKELSTKVSVYDPDNIHNIN